MARLPKTAVLSAPTKTQLIINKPKATAISGRRDFSQRKKVAAGATKTINKAPTTLVKAKIRITKTPTRVTERKATASNQIPSLSTASSPQSTGDSVRLPQAASERLVSKSKALARWYETRFGIYAARASYVVGFMFIAAAGSVLAAQAAGQFRNWNDFQSATLCVTLLCDPAISSPVTDTSLPQPSLTQGAGIPAALSPEIRFRTTPPEILRTIFDVVVAAENVNEVKLFVESRTTGSRFEIAPAAESTGSDRRFTIDPSRFSTGNYQLRVSARYGSNDEVRNITGSQFKIEVVNNVGATPSAAAISTTTPPITALSPVPVSATAPTTTSPLPDTILEPPTSVITTIEPKKALTPVATTATNSQLVLAHPAQAISLVVRSKDGESFLVMIQATDMASVEVFAERTQASQPFFVGNAVTFEKNQWVLNFASLQLPNGNYSIYARGTTASGKIHSTERLPLLIRSPIRSDAEVERKATSSNTEVVKRAIQAEDINVKRTSYLEAPVVTTEKKFIASTTSLPIEASKQVVVDSFIEQSFITHEDAINDMLKRYATAYQSGDQDLQTLARNELQKKQVSLIESALQDSAGKVAVTEIEARLALEFTRLEKRVEFFENLIKERSNAVSAVDTDRDGISDYDEINLYSTLPDNPDTDGDGVNDGTEMASGYDPTSATAEAVMKFTSPKDFGVVREDVLVVQAVVPVIETDSSRGVPAIQAQIRGRGLPNSFVTIFIYSTPVIVTVKTDADGSFVYHFDRELEDGTHEVYAAVTNNRGDIIAKSSAFKFIKEAQAFTPLTTNAESYITSEPETFSPISNVFLVITSLVVLTLGLILIILGLTLRRETVSVAADSRTA